MKTWIKTEILNHCEQVITIQPTPEMDKCIEFYFSEADGTHLTNALYINKDELPVVIEKLQEMMNYVTIKL